MKHPAGEGRAARGNAAESGNALVIALLVLMVLTSAGVAYVAVTKSEKQIAGNAMTASQAMYAAEAGIAEGLHRMSFPAESTNYIGPPGMPTAGWGRYIVLASGNSALDPGRAALAHDGLDNDGDTFVDESGETYPEVVTKQTVNANSLQYPYVRIEYKTQGNQLVRFGDGDNNPGTPPVENLNNGAPILRITASGRIGNAAKTLEAEAVRFPYLTANSALWAGGPLNLNGNAFLVDGHDHDADAPFDTLTGATPAPGILTRGPASDIPMTSSQEDNITGTGGDGSVSHSPFTYDFNQLWAQLSTNADYSYSGAQNWSSSTPPSGSMANPKITAVNGNLNIAGTWTGGGILVVNGNLSMSGGSFFKGIVIVLGDIDLAGGGPADVARCTGAILYQGTVINDNKMGGSARIWYSSEAINAAMNLNRYTLAWWRER